MASWAPDPLPSLGHLRLHPIHRLHLQVFLDLPPFSPLFYFKFLIDQHSLKGTRTLEIENAASMKKEKTNL